MPFSPAGLRFTVVRASPHSAREGHAPMLPAPFTPDVGRRSPRPAASTWPRMIALSSGSPRPPPLPAVVVRRCPA